jgi:hypothetical protein
MSGLARPGHGTVLSVNTVAAPTVFTAIAEVIDISYPDLMRDETETTPHDSDIDCWVLGVKKRSPLTFEINYLFDNTAHSDLIDSWDVNDTLGWNITEPTGTPGAGEWILSGEISLISRTDPVRSGQITAAVTVRPSGPMIIDGTEMGE